MPTTTPTPRPTNGLDRCECGSKYWVLNRKPRSYDLYGFCFDCGAEYVPPVTK